MRITGEPELSAQDIAQVLTSPTVTGKLTVQGGTQTSAGALVAVSGTWNNAAVGFYGLNLSVTNTGSLSGSSFLSYMEVDAAAKHYVRADGFGWFASGLEIRGQLVNNDGPELTASAPLLDLAQTWNNAGVNFTGIKFNVTNSASGSGSLLADLQVGGVSQFQITKSGLPYAMTSSGLRLMVDSQGTVGFGSHSIRDLNASKWMLYQGGFYGAAGCFALSNDCGFQWWSGTTATSGSVDTGVHRSAAGVMEINNGTPGTLRDLRLRKLLDTNGDQVVGTQGAAVADAASADATDLASAITLVNELKAQLNEALARLRDHGLIAT